MRLGSAVALVVIVATSPASAQSNGRTPVVARAIGYAADFFSRFTNVVAEERYVQATSNPRRHRELKSDFLLVKPPGSEEWFQFRDVFAVDDVPVRDRSDRLAKLFLEQPRNALSRAGQVTLESSRFNLEPVGTLNLPLLALAYLQPRYVERFRFTNGPIDRNVGPGVRLVQFREWAKPTILRRSAANGDLPAYGRFWIEEGTGRVVKTELRAAEAEISTSFDLDAGFGMMVPVEMRERYVYRSYEVTGVATYGRFRRFEVRTEETVK